MNARSISFAALAFYTLTSPAVSQDSTSFRGIELGLSHAELTKFLSDGVSISNVTTNGGGVFETILCSYLRDTDCSKSSVISANNEACGAAFYDTAGAVSDLVFLTCFFEAHNMDDLTFARAVVQNYQVNDMAPRVIALGPDRFITHYQGTTARGERITILAGQVYGTTLIVQLAPSGAF